LSLLFAPDHRPDAAAILDFCERIDAFSASYAEGGTADDDPAKGCWVEMLASGLVFDLCGLAPGPPGAAERCEFTTDLEGEATEWSARGLEAITLGPGPHLQGGEAVIPVVRTMCWVGAQLSELSGVEALAWHAAGSWISPSFFRSSTMHWLDGGPFPARGLTAHKPTPDGGLQTVGMSFFTGQELRLEPELVEEPKSATRLAVRLVHWLLEEGALREDTQIELAQGDRFLLRPARYGNLVRVWAA